MQHQAIENYALYQFLSSDKVKQTNYNYSPDKVKKGLGEWQNPKIKIK